MQESSFPFEIIIHDDASTDTTANIIKEYAAKNKRIKTILQKENQFSKGINPVFEYLFPMARGKYIAICEGDDYWTDPLKLQKQVNFLEANPEYGLVHTDVNHWYEKSGTLIKNYNATRHILIPEGDIFNELLDPEKYIIKTPTALFRKELFDRYVDYEIYLKKGWVISDLFIWLSMARFTKVKYFTEAMATYRLLKESLSNTRNFSKKIALHRSVYEIRLYFAERYPCNDTILKKIKTLYVRTLLYDAFKTTDKTVAAEMLKYSRDHKMKLDFKRSLLYYGARNRMIHKLLERFV